MPGLNKSEQAQRFTGLLATAAGRKSRIGDPDAFGDVPAAKAVITELNAIYADGVGVVDRLSRDESRTDVAKHHRAKQEAGKIHRSTVDAVDQLKAIAKERTDAAHTKLGEYLNLDKVNPTILALKIDWIKRQWQTPVTGALKIRDTVKVDPDLAAIMYRTDAYLLEIPDEKRIDWIEVGTKAHVPEADAMLSVAKRLNTLADKLPAVAAEVHSSFYLEGMAAKMTTRVED